LLRSLIITLILQISGLFSVSPTVINIFNTQFVSAQSPVLPIFTVFRDIAGWEIITTTSQVLSWDSEVSENPEIPVDVGNDWFNLTAGWHYLVMYSVPVRSTGWSDRSEIQSWLRINSSTVIPYSYGSSYIRRADGDFEWYNEWAAIVDVAPGDNIELLMQKTDTHTASEERTPNRSGINILKLDDAWDYARLRPATAQAITTSWEDVNIATTDELDTNTFNQTWNDITFASAGKYLVSYNVWTVTTWTDRTNNETRLTLDGIEIDATRGTAYVRAQRGSFTGIAWYVWIIDVTSVNQVLNLQVRRESSMQGTTNNTIPGKSGLTIAKLPDSADYVRLWELGGWQDISLTPNTPLTFDTTIEQGIDLQHDNINTSEIDINALWDYMFFHSVYNSQDVINNANRENPYLEWQISWATLPYWVSGSYNRHSDDGDGITRSSHSSAWVIVTWLIPGDRVELTQTNEASNWQSVYVWWRMGVQWVSLTSLFSWGAYLSQSVYRWRDDSTDFETNGWWLAGENTDIANISKNETIRLRMKVENPWDTSYDTSSQFELQWSETTGSCSSGLSWNSMDALSDDLEMVDSPHISPNAEVSAISLLTNPSWNTHIQSEWYHAFDWETLTTTSWVFVSNSQKEYEFSFRATSFATGWDIYCFRLYNIAENKALDLNNYPKLQMWVTATVLDDVWWEAGSITAPANGAWTTVTYSWGPYTTPVIVWRTNTYNDGNEALVFEARNVTSTSAQVRLCDSNAANSVWCQPHLEETIWYIVVDASQTSSVDGIEAGVFSASQSFDTGPWNITTTYGETFSNIPYVFSSVQTANGDGPVVTRINASTISSFSGWICQQAGNEDSCSGTHVAENFWWIAIDPTINPFFRDMDIGTGVSTTPSNLWETATFSTTFDSVPVAISQTVTNNGWQDVQIDEIQNVSISGMEFRSCELDNDDDCDTHAIDTIRWLAIEEGVFAAEYFLDETHYRWYENNGANTPVTPLAGENTTLSLLPVNNQVRLRMLLQNWDPELPAWVLSLRLQYAEGNSCDTTPTWTEVWSFWWWEDWLHFDNPWVADWATLSSSLLFWGGHTLQSYNESLPTVVNPNPIPVGQWWEWDFSLIKNPAATADQYCFRVVTQANDEIEYSKYARIDTSDAIDPVISSFTPSSGALLPIWNFELEYNFSDADSWIDTSSSNIYLQRWDGTTWWVDVAGTYVSLDGISPVDATYNVTGLPFGRYRVGFEIFDNAWNNTFILHELYVDEVEFIISAPEINIGTVFENNTTYTSDDTLTITVRTVGAAFDVTMIQQTGMDNSGDIIPDWNGVRGFWYEESPFGMINSFWSGINIASEMRDLNINGEKNTYNYDIKYSVLLDIIENYNAGDYESLLDFNIELDYN